MNRKIEKYKNKEPTAILAKEQNIFVLFVKRKK